MKYHSNYIINKANLISNIITIKRKIKNGCKFCAVVKADAYGLGIENVVPIINDYVDCYAVANVVEAEKVRRLSDHKILVLGSVDFYGLEYCANNNISVCVNTLEDVKVITKELAGKRLNVHLKINSGMNRFGFKSELLFKRALNFINKSEVINLEGVCTHFASQENDFLLKQYDFFEKMIKKCNLLTNNNILVHTASTYSVLNFKQNFGNMVRVGFGLYGFQNGLLNLKNTLKITSKILQVTYVNKNEFVGYEQSFKAEYKMKIAVVGFGYADGFNRGLSNNFFVLINGRKAKVIGLVCMDCFIVDVTNVPNVYVGSEVVILGNVGEEVISLDDYAKVLNTSPYEVLTNFKRNRTNIVIQK